MKASQDAYKLIRHFEGLRLKSYRCSAGTWTVGWGHTGSKIKGPMTIDRPEAERYLQEDVYFFEKQLFKMLTQKPLQHEFEAMLSWMFNVGEGAVQKSTLLKNFNLGQKREAAGEFLRWNKQRKNGQAIPVAGLTLRRQVERHLFVTGDLKLPAQSLT